MGAPAHLPFSHVPFAIVPVNIMMSALLSHAERATWQALALHAGGPQKPCARPGVPTLARIAGYSERQVRRALRNLESMGAISLYRERPGCPNEYWLNYTFGVDEAAFMALMQERAERHMDPAQGVRELEQIELALFKEAEQLPLAMDPPAELAPEPASPPPAPAVPTPDMVSAPPDTQMSAPPDTQMSAEQTSNQPEPHHPTPDAAPTRTAEPPRTEVVVEGGGISLSLSNEDLADLADCVEASLPVFDGLMGRPSSSEIVEAALCAPWLGRKFKMDLRGIRAHCVSYARIEANRHWSDALNDKLRAPSVVTRTHVPEPEAKDDVEDPLPEGVSFSDIMAAYKTGGSEAVNAIIYADRSPEAV